MDKMKQSEGSVTLETSIVLPLFIILFLGVQGLFSVVSVQNQMTHTLIQMTKSLSLDSYVMEKIESAEENETKFWGGLTDMALDIFSLGDNPYFVSRSDWYKTGGGVNVARMRFIGYLAGGDENVAREKLRNMKIVNGLDGISFEVKTDDENLEVTIKYEIQYWFDFWGMGKIPMHQTVKSRLWQ